MDILKEVQGKKFDIGRFELAYIKKDDPKVERVEGEGLKNFVK